MKFRDIDIYRSNDFATEKLSKSELQEILSALNSCKFSRRIALPENHAYQQPDNLKENDLCHTTSRKYASINKNLIQVSGYVITFFTNAAKLLAHSVVREVNTGNLLELMDVLYPVDYEFIEHSSGSRGYDLKARL